MRAIRVIFSLGVCVLTAATIYKYCPCAVIIANYFSSINVYLVLGRGTNVTPSDVAEGDGCGRVLLDNDRWVAGVSVARSSIATKSQSVSLKHAFACVIGATYVSNQVMFPPWSFQIEAMSTMPPARFLLICGNLDQRLVHIQSAYVEEDSPSTVFESRGGGIAVCRSSRVKSCALEGLLGVLNDLAILDIETADLVEHAG